MSRFLVLICCLLLLPTGFAQKHSGDLAKQRIEVARNAYSKAKAEYGKDPKNAQKRAAYLDSTTKLADLYMNSLGLAPRNKYPNALKYYREVLKADPKNKHAKESADLIVAIYKSLGKPVPKT